MGVRKSTDSRRPQGTGQQVTMATTPSWKLEQDDGGRGGDLWGRGQTAANADAKRSRQNFLSRKKKSFQTIEVYFQIKGKEESRKF